MTITRQRSLTAKQAAVMAAIDRREPIKVIAADLGVSETRINQHIRALKKAFDVASLPELVSAYRAGSGRFNAGETDRYGDAQDPFGDAQDFFRKPACTTSHLSQTPADGDSESRGNPGEIVFSDAHHVLIDAPWSGSREPVVVPAALDGKNAILYRLAVVVGLALGIIALVILTVTASLSLSTAMDGSAKVRMDETGRST